MSRPSVSSGFTIIELLVVVAIIGILAAVTLSFLGDARSKSKDTGIKKALAETRNQAELFFQANSNRYVGTPGSSDDVCASGAQAGSYRGIYNIVKSAADVVNLTVNTSRTAASNSANPAVCHACTATDSNCGALYRNNWGALVQLATDSTRAFCVDSSGFAGTTTITALASGDTLCAQ